VQDYQLALVPAMIKEHRPDLKVGLFWHIPWPNPEAFRICPFRVEIFQGMLGADLLGFHLQQHCNNFLDTVDRMVEARLDWDHFAAELRGHTTLVRPFPISVQPWSERDVPTGDALQRRCEDIRDRLNLRNVQIGVGVDRIDYTKGIAERFRAIERFFEKHPQHRGRFTFVQLGAPSRTHIPRYRDLVTDLEALADAINWRFKADNQGWKPIEFLVDHHDGDTVHAFLSMASVCIVSSLHDGMNLVAKEFVSAQAESGLPVTAERPPGVLVLSEFAGAARDLTDALIVNPYDTEQFASPIHAAVEMPTAEREQRLAAMRTQVAENNIYLWAADFLTTLAQSRSASPEVVGAATGDTKRP
ncbi:MAG: trehalose-6-phosphate synthase, partial [Phycisphaerales bacterium]